MPTSASLANRVVKAIESAIGPCDLAAEQALPLHEPEFAGNEWKYVKDCIDSTFVSSVGRYVDKFEHMLTEYTGAKHAIAVANGTAALHISYLLAGVQRDEEILIPSLTFVATANAAAYLGAIPHFVDSGETTFGIVPQALRDYLKKCSEIRANQCVNKNTGRVIRALVPMHTFGHPADVDGLLAVAHDFRLVMVEDAAESLGSRIDGRHTGTFGLLGALSFNGNKIVTTGGGGAILTDNPELAKQAKHLTTTAKLSHPWKYEHNQIAYNYRMPNINAALGCAQLERLDQMLAIKRQLFEKYLHAFAGVPEVNVVQERPGCTSNYWLQTILLNKTNSHKRDAILTMTHEKGYLTRPAWQLIHTLDPYKLCPHMPMEIARTLERRLINLPSSVNLMK